MPRFERAAAAAQKFMARLQGTVVKTIANSSAETSLLPATIAGARTIPAGFWTDGASIRIVIRGKCSTRALTPGTTTFKVKLGGLTVVSATTGSLLGGLTEQGFALVLTMTYNAATKVILAAGKVEYPSGLLGRSTLDLISPNAGVGWTTPADADIDVTAQWSSADAANTITATVATVEMLSQ